MRNLPSRETRAALDAVREPVRDRLAELEPRESHSMHGAPDDVRLEHAAHGLDFGEFGHAGDAMGRASKRQTLGARSRLRVESTRFSVVLVSANCHEKCGYPAAAAMQGLIAVTDHDWFEFLCQQAGLDEVNFWRPSDTRTPRQLVPGTPVLFKLRKRHGGWIVGFGIFARHSVLPAWLAWDAFEVKNGATTFAQMRQRIERLRHDEGVAASSSGDYDIGCLMLTQPVFFPGPDGWVKPPADWPDNAVQGKSYDLSDGEGARVWEECRLRATRYAPTRSGDQTHRDERPRYGEAVLVQPRLGQGIFRVAVTEAYASACAVTSEHSLPALEAAHIRPYADGGGHEVPNGLLLRSDLHRLFDKGYVGVTPDHQFVVSKRLKDDFANGRSYYPLDGQRLQLPRSAGEHPDRRHLEWHMDARFRR
jgi:HNH endonuclease